MKSYRTVFIFLGAILIMLIILSVFLTQQLIRAKQEQESQATATGIPTTISSDTTLTSQSTSEPTTTTTATSTTTTDSSIEPTETSTQIPSGFITVEQAKRIALDQVGSHAKVIKVENELDDNPPKYEISLQDERYQYELEIHAITGAVIDLEKEPLKQTKAESSQDD